jgi:high-affinity Fe2+/Pb2+ permease
MTLFSVVGVVLIIVFFGLLYWVVWESRRLKYGL